MTPPKSLTCQVCSKGFISKDQFKKRCPVLLDCGHSVCEECVRAAASKSPLLPCPHCQQLTLVQEKSLPPDAYINGCLVLNVKPRINEDSLTFVAQKKVKNVLPDKLLRPLIPEKEKCEECAVNLGSLMCAKCEDTRFCEACFLKIHRSSKLLSRHVSRPVPPSAAAMAASVGDGGAALPESRCCPLHGDRPLEYYCTDDNVAVCSHCSISGEHKGHTVEPLSDRNARRRPELEQAVQRARNTLLRLCWAAKSVQTATPSQFLDPAELQETIRDHFSQLHGQLQLRQLAITEQLLSAAQTQRAALRDTETAVEESCALLRRLLSQAESALTGGDGAATLDLEPLLQQLGSAADRPCHLTWAETDDDASQVRFLADKELLTSISEHGKLEVDIQPPVRLLAETDLPLDHVVKDITPEMLAEAEEPVRDTASVVSSATAASSVEVLGVAASRPMPPPPRLSSSPRPPSDRRLAAVFPARPQPPPPADGAAAATDGRQATAAAANSSLGPFGQEQVLVTHIKSPSQFYVQCCSQERQLQELMRRVAQWCRNPDSKRNRHLLTLTKNELCLSKYADGRWYRARILDVYPPSEEGAPSEYEVFYVDYGNQEQVLESRLLPITGALARENDMALSCTLWDLLPAGGVATWSQQATHAFAGLVRGEPVAMTTISSKPGRPREVELLKMPNQNIEGDSAQSVRDHLVFIGLANYVGVGGSGKRTRAAPGSGIAAGSGRPPALPSSVTITRMESASSDRRHFYAPECLLKGSQTDVLVSHVDSPETFYIQQLGVHAEYLSNMMDEMQRVYTKSTRHALLNPQKGQVCISQFSVDGKFYRAEIEVLLSHGMLDVYYVDYGNRERVALQAVRKIEDKFMVISKQALKCRLADIQPSDPKSGWQDTVRQHFIEATDNCVLKMYVDSVDLISHVVTLYKCGRDADICINALLAQLSCVRGGAPSTRVVEYSKVGWEPSREIHSTGGASSAGSGPPSVTRLPAASSSAAAAAPAALNQALPGDAAHVAAGTRSLEVSVCHCASPAKFSVQIRDEILNLDRMMRELQEQYGGVNTPSTHGYTWRVDDVAVARCRNLDQRFYRVRVLFVAEAESDKAQVLLIDYGTTVTVQQRDIAVMMKRFEEHRAFALTCQLHGIKPAGDRGVWTGVAIDFFKNMIEKSKKLFLIPKMALGGERTTQLPSLPCDLEAEEHKTVSALEPTRRIRTSLAGKLVEQGLAFSNSRTVDLSEQFTVSSESASLAASMQSAVRGTRPPGPGSEAGGPASDAERRSAAPSGSGSVGNTDGLAAPVAESEAHSLEAGEDLTISCEEDQEIPLGADWATLRSAAAASDPSAAEADDGGCVTPPDQPGRLELIMLEAEEAAELVQQRSAEDWLPATVPAEKTLKAIPTHVTMAGSIYLHTFPRGKETLDVIKQALKTQFEGSQPRPCDSYWFDGQACIAKYYLDEGWYRAKVLQVHKGKVTIQFVDYGNTDRVSPSELRKNIIMEYVPIQALLCELHNIVPLAEDGNYTVKALNFLHSQIVERECHLEIRHFNAVSRRFLVSLRLAQSGLDVGELLVKMGDARYMTDEELAAAEAGASDPLLDALLRCSPYPRLQLPAGVLLPVTVAALLSPALLLVQPQRVAGEPSAPLRLLAQHLEAIDELRERMTEEAESQLMLADPSVGSACLSLFSDDQSWYRAVITGRDGENANVQYVDWGNNETVKMDSLREIPAPLRSLPAWTLLVELCRLAPADASGWSPEAVTAMQECLFKPDVQLWARVKQSLREPPLIELVVIDDPSVADSKTRLAYQPVVDRGLVVLSAPTHRG